MRTEHRPGQKVVEEEERGGEGREKTGGQESRSSGEESKRVSCISKHMRAILKMLPPIHSDEFLSSLRCL